MSGSVNHMVNVYVNKEKNGLLVTVKNPVTSEVHSLKYTEDLDGLLPGYPAGEKWEKLIEGSKGNDKVAKIDNTDFKNPRNNRLAPFNVMQNPSEAGAIRR